MRFISKIKETLLYLFQEGIYIKTPEGRKRIPDDWFQSTAHGDVLSYWNISDEDVVYSEPVSGKMMLEKDERPIVLIDTELAHLPHELVKFVSYFNISPNGYETFSTKFVENSKRDDVFVSSFDISVSVNKWDDFLKKNNMSLPGLNAYSWNSMCQRYSEQLITDKKLKDTDSHCIALVCVKISFLYQYYLIPREAIKGRVRYVINESV